MAIVCRMVATAQILLALAALSACGGGGGNTVTPAPVPPPAADVVTINYLRADPAGYNGWGLHLWGSAIDSSVATTWANPRPPTRIENGQAVFEIPIINGVQPLNFIAHNGDLKSPVHDMSIVPDSFGREAWVVQDEVAGFVGDFGVPFDNEADALAARTALGNKSAGLDLGSVPVNDLDSGLDPDWASHASFMEIYVRGYQDSDGDGIGDIQGLISRLDYLQALGITGLWLMPVTESADNDHGYAVQDYRDIEDDYGSMADFEQLLDEAHARGIAVIIDYVMNHSASSNPLFQDASTSAANPRRDWYVWETSRPAGWNTFAGDPWRNNGNGWYYGVFSALMPDFNLANPDVVAYHMDNLRFWLNKGVDGFRFDAVGVLFENGANAWEDQPQTHALLDEVRQLVDGYGKRFMVCEAPSDPAAYAAGNSCGRAFAFGASAAIINSARSGVLATRFAEQLSHPLADSMPLFLSNHDSFAGARIWDQLNGNISQLRLAAASYLLASRSPFTYYGEETGMAGGAGLSGDHALRTPMSWTGDPLTAGFSQVTPFRALSANSTTMNVAAQAAPADSLLNYYRALLELRSRYPVIGKGTVQVLSGGGEPVLLMTRSLPGETAVIAVNYSARDHDVTLSTGMAATVFAPLLGAGAGAGSDASGNLSFTVPAGTAVVYRAGP